MAGLLGIEELDRAEIELWIEPLETAFDLWEREVHSRYASIPCRSEAT